MCSSQEPSQLSTFAHTCSSGGDGDNDDNGDGGGGVDSDDDDDDGKHQQQVMSGQMRNWPRSRSKSSVAK